MSSAGPLNAVVMCWGVRDAQPTHPIVIGHLSLPTVKHARMRTIQLRGER